MKKTTFILGTTLLVAGSIDAAEITLPYLGPNKSAVKVSNPQELVNNYKPRNCHSSRKRCLKWQAYSEGLDFFVRTSATDFAAERELFKQSALKKQQELSIKTKELSSKTSEYDRAKKIVIEVSRGCKGYFVENRVSSDSDNSESIDVYGGVKQYYTSSYDPALSKSNHFFFRDHRIICVKKQDLITKEIVGSDKWVLMRLSMLTLEKRYGTYPHNLYHYGIIMKDSVGVNDYSISINSKRTIEIRSLTINVMPHQEKGMLELTAVIGGSQYNWSKDLNTGVSRFTSSANISAGDLQSISRGLDSLVTRILGLFKAADGASQSQN